MILTVALLAALFWLWKRDHFVRENLVTDATLRRIRRESANEGAEKDQAEMTRGRRVVMDGPRSRYTQEPTR